MMLLRPPSGGFAFALIAATAAVVGVLLATQSGLSDAKTTLVVGGSSVGIRQLSIRDWPSFTAAFNKHYPSVPQMLVRQSLFMARLYEVFLTSVKHFLKQLSYHTSINKYSDATREEIERLTTSDRESLEDEGDFTDDLTVERILGAAEAELSRRKRQVGDFGDDEDDDDDDIWSSKSAFDNSEDDDDDESSDLQLGGFSARNTLKSGILKPIKAVNRIQGIVSDWLKPTQDHTDHRPANKQVIQVHQDWRDSGCIGWPRDQGYCESCYAFSSTAFAEWAYCRHKEGKFTRLSPQYLINCASRFNREFAGCSRGPIRLVPDFFREYGMELEDNIPYVEETNECHIRDSTPRDNWGAIKPIVEPTIRMRNNTDKLDKALALRPVILSMFVPHDFIAYGGGFIDDCDQALGGHAVLLVGSATEDGTDYLIAQNSLGGFWGLEGYFKIKRTAEFLHKCVKHFMVPSMKFAD